MSGGHGHAHTRDMNTMTRTRVAEALFVSDLQPSEAPSPETVQATIASMIQRYGADGCAARMAARFSDQPELAVRRMIWVHRIIRAVDR